jgi:hypothetical protein
MDIHVYWNIFPMHGPMNVKFPNNTSKWQMGFNSALKGLKWEIFRTNVVEKIKTHILRPVTFFFFRGSCHLWDNVGKYCRADSPQMAIWRMRIACWIPKTIATNSSYVILIAFPPQQWLHERSPVLHLYAHCVYCCLMSQYDFRRICNFTRIVYFLAGFTVLSRLVMAVAAPPAPVRSFVWYLSLGQSTHALVYSLQHALPWLPPRNTLNTMSPMNVNTRHISLSIAILTTAVTRPLVQTTTQVFLAFQHRKLYVGRDWEYYFNDVSEKPAEFSSENLVNFYQTARCHIADEMVLAMPWFRQ